MYLLLGIELAVLAFIATRAALAMIERDLLRRPMVLPPYDKD
jgi:hypothetical protein